ncbi:MAG: hypothetical protein HC898_12635 [Phycisphaerales bacterium]|nr:hypothetical protein [Phycisphaerales bacterium]
MLQRQRLVTGSTTALAETNKASWTRAQWLACEQLGREEMELAGLAQQCLDVLRDDATTVVFPRLVQQLHADMQQAGQWLGVQKQMMPRWDCNARSRHPWWSCLRR